MGCGASSASTGVLEPLTVESRDASPHKQQKIAASPIKAPLEMHRPETEPTSPPVRLGQYASPERGVAVAAAIAARAATSGPVSPPDAADGALLPTWIARAAGEKDESIRDLFPQAFSEGQPDGAQPQPAPARWPDKSHDMAGPRRHSAQRLAVGTAQHARRLAEQERQQPPEMRPTPPPVPLTSSVSEQRGKPAPVCSSTLTEGFLPRKLPPIRREWLTNLADLPSLEPPNSAGRKRTPPKQRSAGLARAREQQAHEAQAEARTRARAKRTSGSADSRRGAALQANGAAAEESPEVLQIFAEAAVLESERRGVDNVEDPDEQTASLRLFRQLRQENDIALATLDWQPGADSAIAAVAGDAVCGALSPTRLGLSKGKMEWSAGSGSLQLDLLELSATVSSLSLSQELGKSMNAAAMDASSPQHATVSRDGCRSRRHPAGWMRAQSAH